MMSLAEQRLLARYYDLDLADDPGDLDLYRALAQRTGGPILELAAGTGRIAAELAADGHEVVALDVDDAMVERAAVRWSELGRRAGKSGGSLELVHGDLFEANLGSRFTLVILALNSLFLLGDTRRQARALAVMAQHLRPGGLAVVDVWLPAPDDLALFDGRVQLEWVRDDSETRRQVLKLASARYEHALRRVELTQVFESTPMRGGAVARHLRRDTLHLSSAAELTAMAEAAGLRVDELAGGYDLAPFGPEANRAVLVATLV
jgi:SAM-dependent methyltransferase